HLQVHRLAGGLGLRHGAPERAARQRRGPGTLHRLRLRRGDRPAGDAALWGQRPAAVLRRRPALPQAVPDVQRMRVPYDWLADWVRVPWDAPELGARLTMAGFEL